VTTERRPWGRFEVLSDEDSHKVKRLTVEPGHHLSYQRHAHRSEHWFVVGGRGQVTIAGRSHQVDPGMAVDVPVGAAHIDDDPASNDRARFPATNFVA